MSVGKRMQRYLVACLSVIITAALAVVPFASSASALETKIALNATNFPDPAFRDYIANLADVDKDGYLDQEECDGIVEINGTSASNGTQWTSLQGIAYFPNLRNLSILSGLITSVDVSRNLDLSSFYIYPWCDSQITDLDFSKNIKLESVYVPNLTQLDQIRFADNGELRYLTVSNTDLASVQWPNSGLGYLMVDDTPLLAADLPQGSFGSADKVSPLKAREIQYNPFEGSYDLKKLVSWFDGSKVSNVRGATMNGSVVSGLKGKVTVRYNYATGMGDIKPVIVFTPQVLPQSADQVKVTVTEGQQPALPSSVNVRYTDGSVKVVPVTWDAHDWAAQKPGTVTLSGTVSGTSLKATAVVTVTQRPYNVTFDSNGGTAVGSAAVEAGQKVTEPAAPTRAGYTFAGWYTAKTGGAKYDFGKPVTADMTLYAHWTINKYTVAFDTNGGSAVGAATVEYGQKITQPAAPSRTGHTFNGWFTAKTGGSKYDFNAPVSSNVTLYAQWTANKYNVTFDSNGGTAVAAAKVEYGKLAAEPVAPSRTGYAFNGWFTAKTGGAKFDFAKPVTADVTLYAQWAINKYTVKFDSNGGSAVAAATVEYGQKVTEPAIPSRTGYTFNGWFTAKTGGAKFDFTKPITADVTLYAQWVINKQTVKFDSNGGSTVSAAMVEYGKPVAQPAAPTRTGYTFAGWYTAKDGGSKYDFAKPVTADMTLYAHWTINKYEVKFDTDGGSAVKSATVEHGKTVDKPADPTRANYTFTGWYTAKSGGEKFDFAKPVTGNVTVFAQWQPRIVFSDVTDKTPHFEDIIWLADNGVSTGWLMPDGKYEFRGMDTVKRQDMAAFLRRLAARHGIAGAQDFRPTAADWRRFRDVDARTPHAEDILWLASTGISTGWKEADGSFTFRGMDTVKRQDMAAFLYRLADKAGKAGGVKPKTDFTDVTAKTPHYKDVEWLGGSGISQGYRNANGTWRFEGMTSVYRQDMAAFLHRLNERLTK